MHRASPHVKDLWDDGEASALTAAGRLIYRSNLLGSDPRITNTVTVIDSGMVRSSMSHMAAATSRHIRMAWCSQNQNAGKFARASRSNRRLRAKLLNSGMLWMFLTISK